MTKLHKHLEANVESYRKWHENPNHKVIHYALAVLFTILMIGFVASSTSVHAAILTANAGPNQTIYLTQTSTATLSGSGTGTGITYKWSKFYFPPPPQSTNPVDPATITSPTSATTTIRGLVQGQWYYQLTATGSSGAQVTDIVIVNVGYDVPPGTLLVTLPLSEMKSVINKRTDTTSRSGIDTGVHTSVTGITIDRARDPEMYIDDLNSKIWSMVEDGYAWNNSSYSRTELSYNSDFPTTFRPLAIGKTYVIEWKGYFAQNLATIVPNGSGNRATIIMQIHGTDPTISNGPPFEFNYNGLGNVTFIDWMKNYNGKNGTPANPTCTETGILPISNLYNQAHTIRLTIREGAGYVGQDAFIKIEVDGVQKYYRNNGQVGEGAPAYFGQDYVKFNTIYDYGNVIVSPSNTTRGRQVTLVTEAFNIYQLNTSWPDPGSRTH